MVSNQTSSPEMRMIKSTDKRKLSDYWQGVLDTTLCDQVCQ
jgi:hypothetical protein